MVLEVGSCISTECVQRHPRKAWVAAAITCGSANSFTSRPSSSNSVAMLRHTSGARAIRALSGVASSARRSAVVRSSATPIVTASSPPPTNWSRPPSSPAAVDLFVFLPRCTGGAGPVTVVVAVLLLARSSRAAAQGKAPRHRGTALGPRLPASRTAKPIKALCGAASDLFNKFERAGAS